MSQDRIEYLDRLIANLRKEQEGLMAEWDELESIVSEYEREADKLEAIENDSSLR